MNYKKLSLILSGICFCLFVFILHSTTNIFYIQNNETRNSSIDEIKELLYSEQITEIEQYHRLVQATLKNGTKLYAFYNETFSIDDFQVFKEKENCGNKCYFVIASIE